MHRMASIHRRSSRSMEPAGCGMMNGLMAEEEKA